MPYLVEYGKACNSPVEKPMLKKIDTSITLEEIANRRDA
jgi:hypothetical protein